VNVSAKDKGTGKEQQIQIQASGGLSDSDIEKMVDEAKTHADEDKTKKEAVEIRNQADSMVYSTEKSLSEHGEKLDSKDKDNIQKSIDELKEVLKDEH
jgi:molecular chaperone DnaK